MANTTLGSLTLQGDSKSFIGECSIRKESNLTPMPLYLLDSNETDVFDYGGVVKTINISGVFIGTCGVVDCGGLTPAECEALKNALTIADCKAFITSCQSLIQGQQDTGSGYPISFVDDYRGTIKVKINECQTDTISGEPSIVRWSFKLVESSTNS